MISDAGAMLLMFPAAVVGLDAAPREALGRRRRPMAVHDLADVVVDLAAPTFEHGDGHHPLLAYVDHRVEETGSPLACRLRKADAGRDRATDHVTAMRTPWRRHPATGAV